VPSLEELAGKIKVLTDEINDERLHGFIQAACQEYQLQP
jgi:hypothetical protein